MIKCSKCNSAPSEDDAMGWKCNSCKKAFKVTKSQLHNILMKKDMSPEKLIIKCPSCKNNLNDGNGNIAWKCSCGNIERGNLKDFENKAENFPKRNLIKCPECGKEVPDTITVCPQCGYEVIPHNDIQEGKTSISGHKNKKFISNVLWVAACICFIIAFTRVNNNGYAFYKGHYQSCMEGYAENKSTANAYTSGLFKNSYNYIASSYEEMAREDNKKIWEYRIQAVIWSLGGVACAIIGYKEYKKRG